MARKMPERNVEAYSSVALFQLLHPASRGLACALFQDEGNHLQKRDVYSTRDFWNFQNHHFCHVLLVVSFAKLLMITSTLQLDRFRLGIQWLGREDSKRILLKAASRPKYRTASGRQRFYQPDSINTNWQSAERSKKTISLFCRLSELLTYY